MAGSAPIQLLIVQPTPFCNLDCAYCYLPHRSNRHTMQTETLAAIGGAIVASPSFYDESTFVWHAGEPCVLPADWYQSAQYKIEAAAGQPLGRQSFQTNATLIDDAWVEFLRDPDRHVGVSLDGPAELHDQRRKTRSGKGTHALTMRGIERLRKGGIGFHVITVVTAASLSAPEAIADALIGTGAESIGLNVEEIEGINSSSTLFDNGSEDRYRRFLERFLDRVEHADTPPLVREVQRFHDILAQDNSTRRSRHQENVPGAIVSVGVGGEVSTFSPELLGIDAPRYGNFRFGNVHDMTDVSEIFLNAHFIHAHREIRTGIRACRHQCPYFGVCGGGSPANKLGEHGRLDGSETVHCRLTIKTTIDTMLAHTENERSVAS